MTDQQEKNKLLLKSLNIITLKSIIRQVLQANQAHHQVVNPKALKILALTQQIHLVTAILLIQLLLQQKTTQALLIHQARVI